MSEQQLAVVPLAKAPLLAGAVPRAIVPIDFDGAYRIANVVVQAGMAPRTLASVEKAMVAILHGLEVGLTPMNALQSIAVINGRPVIWGDGAIGLIRASGLLEFMQETFEGEGPSLTAVCIVKRKGEPKPVRGEFSWSDVIRAGLHKKEGPWQTYPRRMMQMRARWPLRDVFADVLKGLSLREEVEDMEREDVRHEAPQAPQQAPVRRAPPAPSNPQPEATPAPTAAPPKHEPKPRVEAPSDGFPGDKPMPGKGAAPEMHIDGLTRPHPKDDPISSGPPPLKDSELKWLTGLRDAFAQCESIEELESAKDSDMMPAGGAVSRQAFDEALALLETHRARFASNG